MTKKTDKPVAIKINAGKTNTTKKTLVKVVVPEDQGTWVRPEKLTAYYLEEKAFLPEVIFEIETTDPGPFVWKWEMKWDAKVSGIRESAKRGALLKKYKESGSFKSSEKTWKMDFGGKILGGTLSVEVETGKETFKRTIFLKGKNPSRELIKEYSDSLEGTAGFDKILFHEAHGKNFINADGEPVVSFDKGYGITQMTNPAPTYEQCWSWKENIKGGSAIYISKRKLAKTYLKNEGKGTYSEEELQNETYSRYNGGSYYVWNDALKKLVARDYVCDPQVANAANDSKQDKSHKELHSRVKDTFKLGKKGQSEDHPWVYTGVCYAKTVNNK